MIFKHSNITQEFTVKIQFFSQFCLQCLSSRGNHCYHGDSTHIHLSDGSTSFGGDGGREEEPGFFKIVGKGILLKSIVFSLHITLLKASQALNDLHVYPISHTHRYTLHTSPSLPSSPTALLLSCHLDLFVVFTYTKHVPTPRPLYLFIYFFWPKILFPLRYL